MQKREKVALYGEVWRVEDNPLHLLLCLIMGRSVLTRQKALFSAPPKGHAFRRAGLPFRNPILRAAPATPASPFRG